MLSQVPAVPWNRLTIDGIIDTSAPPSDQSKYVNSLEIRLKSSENDVKSKESEIHSLQREIKNLVCRRHNPLAYGRMRDWKSCRI
jgi:hypothetical protein